MFCFIDMVVYGFPMTISLLVKINLNDLARTSKTFNNEGINPLLQMSNGDKVFSSFNVVFKDVKAFFKMA